MSATAMALLTLSALLPQIEAAGSIQDVTLNLSSDRSTCYLGEPVRLELRAKNVGRGAVRGYFKVSPGHKKAEYWYGRKGASLQRFAPRWEHYYPDVPEPWQGAPLPSTLAPGEERVSRAALVVDPARGAFLFDQPGEFALYVKSHPDPDDPTIELQSNTLTVRIEEPPPGQREAYDAYRTLGLGSFVDLPARYTRNTLQIKAARDFLDQYPSGPYSEAVQKAYVELLGYRVTGMIATKEEQTLYFKLMGLDKESIEAESRRGRPPQP